MFDLTETYPAVAEKAVEKKRRKADYAVCRQLRLGECLRKAVLKKTKAQLLDFKVTS